MQLASRCNSQAALLPSLCLHRFPKSEIEVHCRCVPCSCVRRGLPVCHWLCSLFVTESSAASLKTVALCCPAPSLQRRLRLLTPASTARRGCRCCCLPPPCVLAYLTNWNQGLVVAATAAVLCDGGLQVRRACGCQPETHAVTRDCLQVDPDSSCSSEAHVTVCVT